MIIPKRKSKPLSQREKLHKQNIEYAMHEFGFWYFKTYPLLVLFWVVELGHTLQKLSIFLYNGDAHWSNIYFITAKNLWAASDPTPSSTYIGLNLICLALVHPDMIKAYLTRMTFLYVDIRKTLDMQSIAYAIFMSLLATRLTDLILELAVIGSGMGFESILIP